MNSEILIYQNQDGNIKVDVRLQDETVWLTQAQMAKLFGKSRTTITEHIQNVFKEGELSKNSVCRNFRHTAADGKNYDTNYYNLDVIISVGYRVKSHQGTQFRIWATQRLREYIKNAFEVGELYKSSVVRKFRTTEPDGKNYNTNYYNIDVIISAGYRVKSHQEILKNRIEIKKQVYYG